MTHTPSSHPGKLKTILATVGAAAVLVGGTGALAEAASHAKPVLLGKKNKATKTTTIQNKKAKPALALKSKSGPALSVNTNALIANLNADLVDGKSLDELAPTTQTFSIGTAGQPGPATTQIFQTTTLPAGTYEIDMGGVVSNSTGDSNTCVVLDATRYIASGATDVAAIFIYSIASDGTNFELSGHFVGNVIAGNRLMFLCSLDPASTVIQPIQFSLRKLDRTGAVPNVGATTLPRGAGDKLTHGN